MKCDGKAPCTRCVGVQSPAARFGNDTNIFEETKITCAYARSHKKRGKAPKRRKDDERCPEEDDSGTRVPQHFGTARIVQQDDMSYDSNDVGVGTRENGSLEPLTHPTDHSNAFPRDLPYSTQADPDSAFGVATNKFLSVAKSTNGLPDGGEHMNTGAYGDDGPVAFIPSFPTPDQATSHGRRKRLPPSSVTKQHLRYRYPVLQPVISDIKAILPESLACDLIEFYFASISSTTPHPLSPYVFSFMFSKRIFLSERLVMSRRRALLASMLWIAAKTSDSPLLTSTVHTRSRICRQLLELTIRLLRPLVHQSDANPLSDSIDANVPGPEAATIDSQGLIEGVCGTLDDVATYIHIGTVVSASENKRASLRWWNAAWSLARELRLGQELVFDAATWKREYWTDRDEDSDHNQPPLAFLVQQEERRRVYWALYMVDRHLALCYNRPVYLHDRESKDLLQPMDEKHWQESDFSAVLQPVTLERERGPPVTFRGPTIFGFFLPLMHILGDILRLNELKMDLPLEVDNRLFDSLVGAIERKLQTYQQDLTKFEVNEFPPDTGLNVDGADLSFLVETSRRTNPHRSDVAAQIEAAMAYGRYILHVLKILSACRLDPLSLLDNEDNYISSPEFSLTIEHAISAAEAISDVMEYDGDLSYMPYFLGIHLLQGSFLLLLIADKYQGSANARVVRACETVVRAHETCVVTLDTEYQVRFQLAQ
ncbi:MAG: hypothetical protein M1828_002343 [Chrysothrix sp. TS-e1954]|nr:MAG: hypothetical protein M1828_002343 [Chrysothrix sp. TS-e1954]